MGRKPSILLIEDDPELRQGWCEIFAFLGFEFRAYSRGLQVLSDNSALEKANLLITDYYLPDINGVEVVKKIRAIHPAMKVIILTGSREDVVVNSVRQLSDCELLHKPLNMETLEESIYRSLA